MQRLTRRDEQPEPGGPARAGHLRGGAARERIAARAAEAPRRLPSIPLPDITLPTRLDVEVQTADMAQVASWVKGAERTGTRSIAIEGDDPLAVSRSFVALTYITRVCEGR